MSTINQELEEWMRSESPLVEYSKTIKNEGPSAQSQGSGEGDDNAAGSEADPFAGIDFDELPDNIRETLTKAKGEFGKYQTSIKELTDKQAKIEHYARQQQSRADKLQQTVQRHNLNPDDPTPKADPNDPSSDPNYAKYVAHFKSMQLPDEQAAAMAKMFIGASKIQREEMEQRFGNALRPFVATVGNMHADRMLQSAIAQDTEGVLSIPEIQEGVRESLAVVVQNGNEVTPEVIQQLTNMQYGTYMRSNPGRRQTQAREPFIAPSFNPLASTGGHYVPQNLPKPQGPVAANAETAVAANHAANALRALIGKPKK